MKVRGIALASLLLALMPCAAGARAEQADLTIGVLAHRGDETSEKRWEPTAEYLSGRLPGTSFRLLPCDLEEMSEALARGELDFVLTNPGHYVELEHRYGISRIATLKNLRHGRAYKMFGAVIFARADRADIRSLRDLRGKSFAAVSQGAFGGFQMAWRELREAGVDPFHDLSRLELTGFPQDAIVRLVQAGKVDAGTVRTDILEQMERQGEIRLGDFHVLNPLISEDFPFRHSTRLYPEWAFAKAKPTADEVASPVAVALLQLPADHPAAQAGNYAGWTVPLSYQPVHELFRELQIGPYLVFENGGLLRVVRKYWYLFALILITSLFAVFHAIRVERLVKRRTAELSQTNRALATEITERERAERHTYTLLREKRFLAQKCMAVQEDERRYLARELHDELGQCITAMQADAQTIQGLCEGDPRLTASARAIQQLSSRIYEVVHSMMQRLRPSTLDDLGLVETLRQEVDACRVRYPATRYELRTRGDLRRLGERINISLYRIVQECLTNVAKHASAGSVLLELTADLGRGGRLIRLIVQDDGVGMDPASVGSGLGLIGIRERVEALDGQFDLAAAPGRGVRIALTLPLDGGASAASGGLSCT
ncbi:MAG: PhnD/SsuA/transferrin family substrate-binding protein [Chromatiales bacterium]|jgi:two-component system sensor histidine kinase TtrS